MSKSPPSRDATPTPRLTRRRFLEAGASSLAAAALTGPARPAVTAEPAIRERRGLGRTGLEIADIGYGSSRTTDPAVVRHAFDRGVDYFDTAEGYNEGRSEESIAEGLAGHRDEVVITSKTHCGVGTRRAELFAALEGSLRRLRTDRIDIYLRHALNSIEALENPEWGEFAERAKEQGKIRFSGFSGHGGNLVECIDHAAEHDLVDVLLVAFNFGQDPAFYQRFVRNFDFVAVQTGLSAALDRARAKGVGVIAMKTLRGARLNDMRPYEYGGATFAQAAFRWTLQSGHVDSLIVSMKSKAQVDEYVAASGGAKPNAAEVDWLDRYLASATEGYCEHGCAICEASCPEVVPISEVLRARMYARDYGELTLAHESYAGLTTDATACTRCPAPCLGSCPSGIAVGHLTRETHRLLG